MITRLAIVCGWFAAILFSAWSSAAAAGDPYRIEYKRTTLPNGLQVLSVEDFSCPIIAVQVWYHVGSKNESPDRQGFAHMFEHMMFRGTDRLGSTDHFDLIRGVGGDCNAYTSFDQTVYIQQLPANQLDLVLWLEAERMSFLKVVQKTFDTERKVVEEERRMGLNRPFGDVAEKLLPAVFPGHPYRWSPIGNIAHLRAAAVGELREFWNRYYVPNNATLVVVGAVKHEEVQRQAAKYFGWIPKGQDPAPIAPPPSLSKPAEKIAVTPDNAPTSIVGSAFRIVPEHHPDYIPLTMLASILGGGDASRLYRELVAEKQLAVAALAQDFSLEESAIFGVAAVLPPTSSAMAEVEAAIGRQLERLQREPVTARELAKARNNLLVGLASSRQTVAEKARLLGSAAVLGGDPEAANRSLAQIAAMTEVDLLRVARQYLTPERRLDLRINRNIVGTLFSGVKGKNAEESAPITAKPETTAPKPGKPGAVRPSDFPTRAPLAAAKPYIQPALPTPRVLSNGMKVFTVTNHEVPLVVLRLGLKTGAAVEEKPGAASMALGLATKGTARLNEAELANELEQYGISMGGSAELDSASIAAATLSQHLPRALGLLAEVVRAPTFPETEFVKLRNQTRTGMMVSEREPAALAERTFRRALYGDHPYSRTAQGRIADLDALTVADCKKWYARWATPANAALVVAGDVEEKAAVELAERVFGNWQSDAAPVSAVDSPAGRIDPQAWRKIDPKTIPAARPTTIYLVDRPGATQSQIRIGSRLAFTRRDPRHFIARVVGDYFGGAFGSRLNETVRVKLGLTYGASGGFRFQRTSGDFFVSTFSKTATTVQTVRAAMGEIVRLGNEQPSMVELTRTKSHDLGRLPSEAETPQQIAANAWMIESQDLPPDYFRRRNEAVAGADYQSCLRLVAETIDPAKLVVVVVGDASKLKAELEKIAPVETVVAK